MGSGTRRFRTGNWVRGAVAGNAILGRRLVEQYCLGTNRFGQFVALCASDILVRPAQGERGAFLVIEQGRFPLHAVVALGTGGDVALCELLPVDVFVAVLTLRRGSLEVRIHELGLEIRGFMAVDASRRPVCSQQGKLGLGMIESREFLPGFGGVARFAPGWRSVGSELFHPLFELSLMRIVMAAGAIQILPVIDDGRFGLELS